MRLTVMGLLASVACIAPAAAQQFETRDYSSVASGPTRVLDYWACHFPDCSFANCNMVTVQQPSLGTLKPVIEQAKIRAPGSVCDGRPTRSLTLFYTPRRGAHGLDEIVLRSTADNGGRHILRIHVTVP